MICVVWIDDFIIWGSSQRKLVSNLADVSDRLHKMSLFVTAYICRFSKPTAKWCGKICSGHGVEHVPETCGG